MPYHPCQEGRRSGGGKHKDLCRNPDNSASVQYSPASEGAKKVCPDRVDLPRSSLPGAAGQPGQRIPEVKSLLGEAGLPDLRFHDLRHTFATHALTSGVDAKTLSGILGHTKASFTLDTYTHVTGDMQRGAAEIVGGFLTELLGEELEPWQRNENGEMAVST